MNDLLNQTYQALIFCRGNKELPYRMLPPVTQNKNTKYPLLVFLHGSAERGNDNFQQLKNVASIFIDRHIRNTFPSYIVFPQCPHGQQWMNARRYISSSIIDLLPVPSETGQLVVDLLSYLINSYPMDGNKIYLAGISMGGFGTWDLLSRYPERFAAAISICGGGDSKYAAKIKKIPIWVAHGGSDEIVSPKFSRIMVEKLREAGGSPVYTEFPGIGHNSWDTLFCDRPEVFDWLYSKSLPH